MLNLESISFAQMEDRIILGKVVDGQNLAPLPNANVAFVNSDVGTSTDIKGNFTLKNSINANKLIISYVGYKSAIINLDSIIYNQENVFALSHSIFFCKR